MGTIFGTVTATDLDSSSGAAFELRNKHIQQQTHHQLTLVPASGASGTVAIKIRTLGAPEGYSEPLYESASSPAIIDLSQPVSFCFEAFIDAVVLDCSGIIGTCDAILESR